MNVLSLKAPPLPAPVRIGLIGTGARGLRTLERFRFLPDACFTVLADYDETRLACAAATLLRSHADTLWGHKEPLLLQGEDAWLRAVETDSVDLLYVCTPWRTHARIAREAMLHGKHVAVEVPLCETVEECHELVRVAELTRRHLFLLENCCYDWFSLAALQMKREGCLGTITHCEGAYIHQLHLPHTTQPHHWMRSAYSTHYGNAYPTHGVGPLAQLLGIHRTDRFESLTSLTSDTTAAPADRINTTLLRTERGVTLLLQLDVATRRPYSRMQTICTERYYLQKYPQPTLQAADADVALLGTDAENALRSYLTSPAGQVYLKGESLGVENPMNYAMDRRLIDALRAGTQLDIDAYDAAEWSCLAELTERSARAGGMIVEVPRFV